MKEDTVLNTTLDRMEKLINSDRDLSTKGFGLLLMGRKFFDSKFKEKVKDPIDVLLDEITIREPNL